MKNRLKLFCTVLAAAFMLTACGGPKLIGVELPETPLVLATGENGYGRNLVYLRWGNAGERPAGSGLYQRR